MSWLPSGRFLLERTAFEEGGRLLPCQQESTELIGQSDRTKAILWFYLYTDTHEAIVSDEMFMAVQQKKLSCSKEPHNQIAIRLTFSGE